MSPAHVGEGADSALDLQLPTYLERYGTIGGIRKEGWILQEHKRIRTPDTVGFLEVTNSVKHAIVSRVRNPGGKHFSLFLASTTSRIYVLSCKKVPRFASGRMSRRP